jgi:hypothetical protein
MMGYFTIHYAWEAIHYSHRSQMGFRSCEKTTLGRWEGDLAAPISIHFREALARATRQA